MVYRNRNVPTDSADEAEIFPWFKESKLADVLNVELYSGGHIYWPALDVDLSTTILENPERFPLKSKKSN